jgi:hypothetical protein
MTDGAAGALHALDRQDGRRLVPIQRFNDSTVQRFNDSTIQRFNDSTFPRCASIDSVAL